MLARKRTEAWSCRKLEACPVGTVCLAGEHVPCIDIACLHKAKLKLCDALEAVANGLPVRIDRLRCLGIASDLVPLLREGHRFEEETVFPAFLKRRGEAAVIARLAAEHLEEDCAAEELTEALLAIGHGGEIADWPAFRHMLRAFSSAIRRHVAFERDHILSAIAAGPEISRPPAPRAARDHRR